MTLTLNNVSILVVDDSYLNRSNAISALSTGGYTDIREAGSGIEALKQLNERPAQIVVADWVMPEMDGIALTEIIREQDKQNGHYTAVLMATTKDSVESLVQAFECGVDDYIRKPFDHRELVARTFSAERIARLHQQLIDSAQSLEDDNQRLQKEVLTDPLTGVWNRRYISLHLDHLIKLTLSRGGVTYCAVVDLDNFKRINDDHGHDVGDEVLKNFCGRIRKAIRPIDVLARFGGEEFVILMHHDHDSEHISIIFGRIREALISKSIKSSAGDIPLTASFGIASFRGKKEDRPLIPAETLLKWADEKVYQAKDAGRNCIIF